MNFISSAVVYPFAGSTSLSVYIFPISSFLNIWFVSLVSQLSIMFPCSSTISSFAPFISFPSSFVFFIFIPVLLFPKVLLTLISSISGPLYVPSISTISLLRLYPAGAFSSFM